MTRRLAYWASALIISFIAGIALSACFNFFVPFLIIITVFSSVGMNANEGILDDDGGFPTFFTSLWPGLFLIVVAIMLFVNPKIVYRDVHCAWIIIIPIFSVMFATFFKPMMLEEDYDWSKPGYGIASIIINVAAVIAVIVAVIVSVNSTYHITEADDMHVLANAPQSKKTVFILENDIDFSGENTRWFGKKRKFKGVFDGQGYTLSNIEMGYQRKTWRIQSARKLGYKSLGVKRAYGMVRKNVGVIKNLNFENCSLNLKCNKDKAVVCMTASYRTSKGTVSNCNAYNCYVQRDTYKYKVEADPNDAIINFNDYYDWNYYQ